MIHSQVPGLILKRPGWSDSRCTKVIDQYGIKTMLDIPCGDWFWMQHVDLSNVRYTGADIVEKIIQQNQQYAGENIFFRYLDLLSDELPKNDLVFCRDCLVHFSYEDVGKALENLTRSGSKYLLTTPHLPITIIMI